MLHLSLDGVLGQSVEIDLCASCRAFWFDPFETLHLTPQSTLRLFAVIADQSKGTDAAAFPSASTCPRCRQRLILTHDRQRTTAFQYWRCDAGHGRFTSFIDFLREKDFVRPLSPQQLKELRENVQQIHCSSCGAPIDLTRDSACPHCAAPLSMLDIKRMRAMADGIPKSPGGDLSLRSSKGQQPPVEISQLLRAHADHGGGSLLSDLIDLGLQSVAGWLSMLGSKPEG